MDKIILNTDDLILDSSDLKIVNSDLASAIKNGDPELENNIKLSIKSFDLSKIKLNSNGEVEILDDEIKNELLEKMNSTDKADLIDINIYKCGG